MRDMGASADQAAGVKRRAGEAWVYEKGLPRICREPLVDHLGRRVLLATDLSDASRDVDARAIELAEEAGADLLILAIIRPEASGDGSFQKRLGARVRLARRRGIDAEGRIVAGDPADSILRVAASTGADAIVIGYDQWRGWASAGCVCGHVILHAPCPVLIKHLPTAA